MLMGKLFGGVLRVLTPLGPRYVKPTLSQRLYLIWIFRHFDILPLQVLNARQRRLIDTLCVQRRFVSLDHVSEMEGAPLLGTVERRPPVEVETPSPKRPNDRASAAQAAGGLRQQS